MAIENHLFKERSKILIEQENENYQKFIAEHDLLGRKHAATSVPEWEEKAFQIWIFFIFNFFNFFILCEFRICRYLQLKKAVSSSERQPKIWEAGSFGQIVLSKSDRATNRKTRFRTFFNFCVPEPVYYFPHFPSVLFFFVHPRFPPTAFYTFHIPLSHSHFKQFFKIKKNDLTVNCFMQFTLMLVTILTITKQNLSPFLFQVCNFQNAGNPFFDAI